VSVSSSTTCRAFQVGKVRAQNGIAIERGGNEPSTARLHRESQLRSFGYMNQSNRPTRCQVGEAINQTSCTSVVTGYSPSIGSNPFNARVPNRRTGIQRRGPAFRFLWGKPVGVVGGTPRFVPPAVVGRLLSRMSQVPKIYICSFRCDSAS
jgi:hypothetical protein